MTTQRMFDETNRQVGPVTCLGQTFADDTARRAHFSALLREKLQDPAFRAIEGFPHGSDDDIIALSDPPYYTACPNPWLADFVAEWEAQKPAEQRNAPYSREPFAADVSEGKNDPIYNAHSYHTKVPHKAIMRYILHYTQPGDIVFDGFCGTGMTGVAAQMCGNKAEVESLGYKVADDGTISQEVIGDDGRKTWQAFSKIGARKAVLNDLSPAATFIAYNYNTPVDVQAFEREAKRIFRLVENELGWMYETNHNDGSKAKINYMVWSDVFICPNCLSEIVFWDAALDNNGEVIEFFPCKSCNKILTKRELDYSWITTFDENIQSVIRQNKSVPVLISYTHGTKRYEKKPDAYDLETINTINGMNIPFDYPVDRLIEGRESRRNDDIGITHVHHFYTKRNLWVMAAIWKKSKEINNPYMSRILMNFLTATQINLDKRYTWRSNGKGGIIKGTMYIPSFSQENSVFQGISSKFSRFLSGLAKRGYFRINDFLVSIGSCERILIESNSLDYLFVDPPFGANLNYSELSCLWESWLGIHTNTEHEAIENTSQGKPLRVYQQMMQSAFVECYRVLKPGNWMTVEFSNTNSSVWNAIQTSLTSAGFVIANVSALDKKQGSFKAVTTNTAVKQDLVISAYKPSHEFEQRFAAQADTIDGVWEFIRNHLRYLPVVKRTTDGLAFVTERDPRILYDQVIAYYIRKGFPVPIDSPAFQLGLMQRFVERDEMYFLPDQAIEYDRVIARSGQEVQANLFVSDESSAIQWLRQMLKRKPQTFADINPEFMQQLGGWSKNEAQLDLRELLEQNFLRYDGVDTVPNQIHAYLSTNYHELRNKPDTDAELRAKAKDRWYVPDPNKAQDLEQVRERALLREFDGYVAQSGKLKVFRLEAIRAGFKRAYQQRDYRAIATMAKRIPSNVIEEDEKLLMWVDTATMRLGE